MYDISPRVYAYDLEQARVGGPARPTNIRVGVAPTVAMTNRQNVRLARRARARCQRSDDHDMNTTIGLWNSIFAGILKWITLKFVPDARKLLQEQEVLLSIKLLPTPVVDAIDFQRKCKIL